jgi:FKBP-type peptidyl-prolyl cis-trans isomerase SlpA
MKLDTRTLIHLEYAIRIKGGDVVESSVERGPLVFAPGRRRLLPALERVIAQMQVGETQRGELGASEAFGDESLLPLREIPKAEFSHDEAPEPGRVYEARTPEEGKPLRFKIQAVDGETVTVRFLHPLSDKAIEYHLRLLRVESLDPPPPPARAFGIESAAIQLHESSAIQL